MEHKRKIFVAMQKVKPMAEYILKETAYPLATRQEIVGELIRCKDCKYWKDEFAKDKSTCWLPCMSMTTPREWYCGRAERSADAGDKRIPQTNKDGASHSGCI